MKNILKLLLFMPLICVIVKVNAQNVIVEGQVLDNETNAPLEGAACIFKMHQHIGGITDKEGKFRIRIPDGMSKDILTFSFLGFQPQSFALQEINLSEKLYVRLNRASILLNEVTVIDNSIAMKKMFMDAVKKIPNNYPSQPHLLQGFYRKISTEGSSFTHLFEAAVAIEDYDYKKPVGSIKIEVITYRETPDRGKVDSIQLKVNQAVRQNAAAQWKIAANPLYRTYEGNFLRLFKNQNNTFNLNTLLSLIDKHYEFKMVGYEIVNNDTICHLAFSEGVVPQDPSGRNYFKINLTDNAITEFQFTHGLPDRITYKSTVRFQKYQGRYYPEYIRITQPRFINRENEFSEYDIETYWFDQVEINDFKKIQTKKTSDRLKQHPTATTYNPEFWEKYTPLTMHPLEANILQVLETNGPLEQQFLKK
jgi:hypothetical protein